MQVQDFAKFVASQQRSTQHEEEDAHVEWANIRRQWLEDLDELYAKIGDFLQEYVAAGSIHYSFTEITLTEEDLGSYQVRRMDIDIGREHISLEPIATLLIGSRGRVDVVGSAGRAQLSRVNENAKGPGDLVRITVGRKGAIPELSRETTPISWVWRIVHRDGRVRFVELSKESFFSLLMEVAGA
jgi:hypothetical protein